MAIALIGAGVGAGGIGDDGNDVGGDDAGGGHTKALRAQKIQLSRDTSEPADVYSWFEITLKSIEVPSQTFDCSIEIHLFWQDFNLPNIFPDFDKEDFIIDDDDLPVKMSEIFENKLSCDLEGDPVFQYYQETGTIYMMFVVECTFVERMELQRFPLDRQFLNMEFNAWVKEGNWNWTLEPGLDWVPEKYRNEKFAVRMVSSITEYECLGPWIDFSTQQPLSIRLRVNRVPTYYFGNIVFPNFLIVAGCFAAFAVPRTEVADRLSVTVTLMLAAVAFRFVVSTMLPKVAYLTIMDKYLLFGFIALIVLIAENAFAGVGFIDNETAFTIDWATGLGFGVIWIIVHGVAIIAMMNKDFYRVTWEEMDRIDSEEDPDAEFVKADPKYIKSPEESEFCQQAWNKAKMRSPTSRAKLFELEHPDLAEKNRSQNLPDDEEEKKDENGGGTDGAFEVPSKVSNKTEDAVPSKAPKQLSTKLSAVESTSVTTEANMNQQIALNTTEHPPPKTISATETESTQDAAPQTEAADTTQNENETEDNQEATDNELPNSIVENAAKSNSSGSDFVRVDSDFQD